MTEEHMNALDELIEEITRYLAVVDAFRAASCEPSWRPEPPCTGTAGAAAEPSAPSRAVH